MAAVWPDASVEENSLARAVADIRKALGEGPKENRFIATVARRGYRFRPEVTTVPSILEPEFRQWPGYALSKTFAARCNSVAVLPFSWLTVEGSDSSLSVGMADAVITRLLLSLVLDIPKARVENLILSHHGVRTEVDGPKAAAHSLLLGKLQESATDAFTLAGSPS